ncbi:MAG: dihydropteroate synthase [Coriobacteriales bacterium]|jgi:dihydropteroate synthase|nr:dihydropteroate synthase [Coriobacteriales bacterium]
MSVNGGRRYLWQCAGFHWDRPRPLVMGILNVTPDSFSDGGAYLETERALSRARALLMAGADIIDVGGESTRPGAAEIEPREELARVLPVVRELAQEGVCVSIDSRHPQTVAACLQAKAAIINDITGFSDRQMVELAAGSQAGCVIMHMQGRPQTMQHSPHYKDVVAEVSDFLLERAHVLEAAGVKRQRICLDPGPGFGKNREHNLTLLSATKKLAHLGKPPYLLLAAWSRKRFIGELTGVGEPDRRLAGSLAAALYAASQGAGVLRVHDVGSTVEALKVLEALGCFGEVATTDNAGLLECS